MKREQIERLKETYPTGTPIELSEMAGEPQMKKGLKGTVTKVDDAGQIHVRWENGSSLALNAEQDDFCIGRSSKDTKPTDCCRNTGGMRTGCRSLAVYGPQAWVGYNKK